MSSEKKIVQALTREIRNATGYERTPQDVIDFLTDKNVSDIYEACRKVLDSNDLIQAMAKKMKMQGQDRIPSSVDLNMGV